jgi:hypothetical protein
MNYFESRLFEFRKIETIFEKKKSAPKENINPIQIPKQNFSTNNATNIIPQILSESIILLKY